jgi:hypothetical protein
MIMALLQLLIAGLGAPNPRAAPYIMVPEIMNRVPAMRNGGID